MFYFGKFQQKIRNNLNCWRFTEGIAIAHYSIVPASESLGKRLEGADSESVVAWEGRRGADRSPIYHPER
jgi:hypothetical protein